MKSVEAIILAGGRGKRMGEITDNEQKCLLPIDGKPMLLFLTEQLIEAFGSVDIKIGVAYKQQRVKEFIDRNKPKKASFTYVPMI